MFDMPADIPYEIIQPRCEAVYEHYIHPANEMLLQRFQERLAKAKSQGMVADEGGEPAESFMDEVETKQQDSKQRKADKADLGDTSSTKFFAQTRYDAIRQLGIRLGAQKGLQWRYGTIKKVFKEPFIANALTVTFDFTQVMAPKNILYPVLVEARNNFEISKQGQSMRTSRVSWEIIQPARIVPVTPTWRDYLYQDISTKSVDISEGVMPMNDKEARLWKNSICDGYKKGVKQANMIFSDRVQRLVRDYKGMLYFRQLTQMNIVSEPKVIEGRLGVTITKNRQKVNVDDRMIRISVPAQFNNAKQWKVIRTLPYPIAPKASS